MDRRLCVLTLAAALAACGSSLPRPDTGPHPAAGDAYVEVAYPPPPARIEVVPSAPDAAAVWVSGEWTWQASRWVWEPGGWIDPPPNAYLAPSATLRISDGRMLWLPNAWYDRSGKRLPKPDVRVYAQSSLAAGDGG